MSINEAGNQKLLVPERNDFNFVFGNGVVVQVVLTVVLLKEDDSAGSTTETQIAFVVELNFLSGQAMSYLSVDQHKFFINH